MKFIIVIQAAVEMQQEVSALRQELHGRFDLPNCEEIE